MEGSMAYSGIVNRKKEEGGTQKIEQGQFTTHLPCET